MTRIQFFVPVLFFVLILFCANDGVLAGVIKRQLSRSEIIERLKDYETNLSELLKNISFSYGVQASINNSYDNVCFGIENKLFSVIGQSQNVFVLGQDMYIEVVSKPRETTLCASYINIPQDLNEILFANLDIAPFFGFFNHSIPQLVNQKNLDDQFFLHEGTFFLPSVLNKLLTIEAVEIIDGTEKSIYFHYETDTILLDVTLLHDDKYRLKHFLYKNKKAPVGGISLVSHVVTQVNKSNSHLDSAEITITKEWQGGKDERDGIIFNLDGRVSKEKIIIKNIQNNAKLLTLKEFVSGRGINNGTKIYMRDAPQLQYVWLNNKIALLTDELALSIAQGDHKFFPAPNNPRFWFMVIGAIIFIIGFSFKFLGWIQEYKQQKK
ncbi:MAG: hypothetical protein LBP59_19555 [Planctomycetaceae bacterium]|nr:hypothetical protein [Planctomycetaceae bacterium]